MRLHRGELVFNLLFSAIIVSVTGLLSSMLGYNMTDACIFLAVLCIIISILGSIHRGA